MSSSNVGIEPWLYSSADEGMQTLIGSFVSSKEVDNVDLLGKRKEGVKDGTSLNEDNGGDMRRRVSERGS